MSQKFKIFYFAFNFFIIYLLLSVVLRSHVALPNLRIVTTPMRPSLRHRHTVSASLKIFDLSVAPPQHWLRVSVALRHGEAAFSRVCNPAPAAFPACRPSVPVSLKVIYLTLCGSLRSHKKGLSATFFSPLAYAIVLRKACKQPLRCHTGGTPFPRIAWQWRA